MNGQTTVQLSFDGIWARGEMTTEALAAWERTLDDFARLGDVPTCMIGRVWVRLFRDLGLIRTDYYGRAAYLTRTGEQAE